jgi:hypothetical protein
VIGAVSPVVDWVARYCSVDSLVLRFKANWKLASGAVARLSVLQMFPLMATALSESTTRRTCCAFLSYRTYVMVRLVYGR